MKHRFLLVLMCLSQCATDCGSGEFYSYTVINKSGKNVIIEGYLLGFPDVPPLINYIESGMELTKTHQDHLPPSPYSFRNFFGDINDPSDSIKIIYGAHKVSFFTEEHSENKRNPLNLKIYNTNKEVFNLTVEDYENAEDCNGDCE